jgi:hypothetical protein
MKTKRSIDDRMVRPAAPDAMVPGSLVTLEPPVWEYQTVVGPDTMNLNAFAADGWELVSVKSRPADQAVYYFRRRRVRGCHS